MNEQIKAGSKLVREMYPKAWSQGHPCINPVVFTIQTGQDRDQKDRPYRSRGATPYGWKIGEGETLLKAWKNAGDNLTSLKPKS